MNLIFIYLSKKWGDSYWRGVLVTRNMVLYFKAHVITVDLGVEVDYVITYCASMVFTTIMPHVQPRVRPPHHQNGTNI